MLPFQGTGWALSSAGMNAAAATVAVTAAEIWTVIAVETSGCGFLADRRPKILFERHVFHRLTRGQFDDGDISDPTPGGYGARGAAQFDRLARAVALDRDAALQSASWGMGQIMGENYRIAGYPDVETMVAAMCDSEDIQLGAMARFLTATTLDKALRQHHWTKFARGYNGPAYKQNNYDKKLEDAYAKFSIGKVPDLDVRGTQLYLSYLGFDPGPVDGKLGPRTLRALQSFQSSRGLPASSQVTAANVAQLLAVLPQLGSAAETGG